MYSATEFISYLAALGCCLTKYLTTGTNPKADRFARPEQESQSSKIAGNSNSMISKLLEVNKICRD